MDKDNKMFTAVLVSFAAVAGGLAVVFSIGLAVQSATAPLTVYLKDIADSQKRVEITLNKTFKDGGNSFEARITALENEIRMLKSQPGQQPMPSAMPEEDVNKVYDIPVAGSYVLGPKDAPVTITVFEDYQCPFCARFYPAILEAQKAFPDKVSIVVKMFPLPMHNMARDAAKAVLAAGEQGKFYEMTDLVFANAASLSEAKFKELAGQAKLNVAQFTKDLKEKDALYEKKITEDMSLGIKVDVRGTPTYFINGKKSMSRTPEAWKSEIGSLLAK